MRKVISITISTNDRDKGKVFQLREMPASKAEKWAARAFLALAKSGVDIPDDIAEQGVAGIAAVGIKALSRIEFSDAEALLDEMFDCVQFIPDPSRPDVVRGLIEDDIEEVATRVKLRKEVLALHLDFFTSVAP